MDLKYYLRKAKDVKWKDVISAFPMMGSVICTPFVGKNYKQIWAICERKGEARDNGYHFFKYMTQNHPEQKCVYVIDKNCSDYRKVRGLGEIIQFGSLKHWLLYFNCPYLISSQRFLPNAYMGTLLERTKLSDPAHVFLQHGITINKPEYLKADRWKVSLFTTATPQETEFVKKELGYSDESVACTGFARFDALHDFEVKKNRILVMPTWRKWLGLKSEANSELTTDLKSSDYIKNWKSLLKSEELSRLIRDYKLEVIFIPHPNMRDLLNPKDIAGSEIVIANPENADLQGLLKSSEMIITDYSSVFFDMAYMKKPVIFFQFDEDNFRKYHYEAGWFNYRKSALGDVCTDHSEVISALKKYIQNGYEVSRKFLEEHKETFPLYDTLNSERIYKTIRNIKRVKK